MRKINNAHIVYVEWSCNIYFYILNIYYNSLLNGKNGKENVMLYDMAILTRIIEHVSERVLNVYLNYPFELTKCNLCNPLNKLWTLQQQYLKQKGANSWNILKC